MLKTLISRLKIKQGELDASFHDWLVQNEASIMKTSVIVSVHELAVHQQSTWKHEQVCWSFTFHLGTVEQQHAWPISWKKYRELCTMVHVDTGVKTPTSSEGKFSTFQNTSWSILFYRKWPGASMSVICLSVQPERYLLCQLTLLHLCGQESRATSQ